ncbi:SIMPL domain-containing protein [Gilvimarinus agarilyticus]|uniref:SIMPL domain-containing protein n=1 Tax=Gilvimarinus sp. 2_MG-2023 TaxID=3062666 RepID=UPI001C08B6C2|nr:SIMPL domain-containing protein [Gilvimarinus sp. 2_MG-2023]MBU2887844.1 SIMPL domain-containing protein [Gilvimarinus agarilyticus]MDO6572482.1 SIMPL domain-containing protein [Gilvimarinus sp. 2_MG-2023]
MQRILFALLLFTSLINSSHAQQDPGFAHLTVAGEAKLDVAPDTVTLKFQIMEYSKSAQTAVDTVTQRAADIVEMGAQQGLEREHIESWAIDKRPRRSHQPGGNQPLITGYEVTQKFTLTIEGLDAYQAIVNHLMRMPNTTNLNATFDVSKRELITAQLTEQAGADARRKAQALAGGLDVELGRVYSITDQHAGLAPYPKFGVNEAQFRSMAAGAQQPQFELFAPQSITLSKKIQVVFAIKE